jgi:NADPH:quinone reductase
MTKARRWIAKGFGGPEVLEEIRVDLPDPGPGEVTLEVRAAGMNPADYKHFRPGQDPKLLPLTIGSEAAGVIAALGPDTEIASGGGDIGDEVVAFRVSDGYSSALNSAAGDVFAKPRPLTFSQAANLLLVGTTAAETLNVVGVAERETVLVHGAAGGVGSSVVQQAVGLTRHCHRNRERGRLRRRPRARRDAGTLRNGSRGTSARRGSRRSRRRHRHGRR